MKRIPTIVLTVLFCLLFAVMSFAENIYIIDDDDDFVPQTTTAPSEKPAETTTAPSGIGSIIGNGEALDGYLGDLSDKIGSGLDSVLSGLGDTLNQWGSYNPMGESTTADLTSASGDSSSRPSYSVSITTAAETTAPSQPETTTVPADNTTKKEEVASVLVVNQASDNSQGLSGSTLTLIVFIAAIVLLVLVALIVLVLMTRRTEYNSAVMHKSTLPSVDQPKTLSQFMEDDIGDDGVDYGNIAYWNDN